MMKSTLYYIIFIIFICLCAFVSISAFQTNETLTINFQNPLSIEININPYQTFFEGDIVPCSIYGDYDTIYWTINNQSHHYTFIDDEPVLFNPESTPLNDQYVNLTIHVKNSNNYISESIPIKLYKIYFGDLHWHTIFSDGDYSIDEIYQNTIFDNYLDFSACTDHGNMKYPTTNILFKPVQRIINTLLRKDPWLITKNRANQYYDPGNFTTFLAYEWSGSNMFPGGFKFSRNGSEDVGHINFYYKDIYPDAKKYSMYQKMNYYEIFTAMADENKKGHLNIGFPHHSQGKIYLFSSTLVNNPNLKNFSFLHRFVYDFTTNFSYLLNEMENTEARDKIIRGVEVFSRWGTSIGQYSNIPISWPYYPDNPLKAVVCANKTDAWVENGMWEWSEQEIKTSPFSMHCGSDTHHIDRAGSAFLWRDKPAGITGMYSVHNTRDELWDAMNSGSIYGSQLLKIRANVRFDDQMALGNWINCSSPLTINISAMSTFPGYDTSGKTMTPHLYPSDGLDYPISDIWIVKKDRERGRPWCKIIHHEQPDRQIAWVTFEDDDVKPNDFYYIVIRQHGKELIDGQDVYTAFLGPVFIDTVTYADGSEPLEQIDLNIAMLSETPIGWDKLATKWYQELLEDYEWKVGNTHYRFVITPILDEDILNGELNDGDYDVLLVPGGGVGDELSITKGYFSKIRPNVMKWKKNILEFIENGGGYIGYCGGAALMCDLGKEPETFLEYAYDKSSIGASDVLIYWKKDGPSVFLDAWSYYTDETHGYPYYNGLCFDIPLNTDHPIFDDFIGETCRIRWIGGASFLIPATVSSNVTILGRYPEGEISENKSTQLRIWDYTGGITGLIKGYVDALKWLKTHDMPLSDAFVASIDFRYDWELTDEYATLNYSEKPCIVTEVYPNEQKGRLVLDTLHPERNVWWGGHFEEFPDTEKNSVAGGLYKLTDYVPFDETVEDEMTHTWWMVRREIAWAAKIPDNDLPPVHGPSQACDIIPYVQEKPCVIRGNVEPADGIVTVDLYYRHSIDNVTWCNWSLYDTDSDGSNGWCWVFNPKDVNGFYQFNTIRRVHHGYHWNNETMSTGPDAIAYFE